MKNNSPVTHIWIRAEGGSNRSVIYYDREGNQLTRYLDPKAKNPPRGSKSWRHQNPGNISSLGPFAHEHGSIGSASYPDPDDPEKMLHFAIFPSYEIGRKAMASLLKTQKYIDSTLHDFPRRYTGIMSAKIPDTKAVREYRKNLQIISKLDLTRTIRSLNDQEYEQFLNAVQRCEGWYPGDEKLIEIKKVVGVKCSHGKAIEFLVEDINGMKEWVTKEAAILLAEEMRLLAVVVHSRYGAYLRAWPHWPTLKSLLTR